MKESNRGDNNYQPKESSAADTTKQELPDDSVQKLESEIEKLQVRLNDRKAALPMHDATPQQWIDIEELEDEIAQKKKELKHLGK